VGVGLVKVAGKVQSKETWPISFVVGFIPTTSQLRLMPRKNGDLDLRFQAPNNSFTLFSETENEKLGLF
jgi:hypothetical protein